GRRVSPRAGGTMFVHSRTLWILLATACVQRPSTVAAVPDAVPVGRERVEGTETDGECTADADCVKTGCSSELCIAKSAAAGVMSTCEMRTCFQVLESCTCQEGHCRWVVGARKP